MDELPGQMSIYDLIEPKANTRATPHGRETPWMREARVVILRDLLQERHGYTRDVAWTLARRILEHRQALRDGSESAPRT